MFYCHYTNNDQSLSTIVNETITIMAGRWFQTLFIFHNILDNPSHWLIFFQDGQNHQPDYYGMGGKRKLIPAEFCRCFCSCDDAWFASHGHCDANAVVPALLSGNSEPCDFTNKSPAVFGWWKCSFAVWFGHKDDVCVVWLCGQYSYCMRPEI